MGVVSTRRARLQGDSTVVPSFRSASASKIINLQELVHAGTKGGRQRISGIKDWNGSYSEYGFVPSFFPGDEVTYYGSIDGASGYTGDALITQVVITIPVGTKGAPTIEGTFRGIAELSLADTTAIALPTVANTPDVNSEGICVQLQAITGGAFVNQDGTNEITITLSIEDQEFHHCGSSGIMDAIEGLWDAQISYKRYVDDLTDLPTVGTAYNVRVPIDSAGASYYGFSYMRVGDITDITLNRESGDFLNVTIPLMMSMIEEISGTATLGTGVTKPSGSVWRPNET